jgi:hypothetical protein
MAHIYAVVNVDAAFEWLERLPVRAALAIALVMLAQASQAGAQGEERDPR